MVDFSRKKRYDIGDLIKIMEILRSEDGCPWDKVQDHHTIRNNFIEETYEVMDAIDRDDPEDLREELGDVLLQVVFHSQMESEKKVFDFDDVSNDICCKLIERHPHIFGDINVDSVDEVLNNWDAIKQKSKSQTTATDTLNAVPMAFPALMRAAKVQKRAAKVGFDWPDESGAFDKIAEESAELKSAFASGDKSNIDEELGDLLFSVVNVSRFIKSDAEQALQASTDKFISRFAGVERLANERGIDMKTAGIDALDALWDEVKSSGK